MGVDWKKEVKLSDLFRRGPKEPRPGDGKREKEPKAAGERTSLLKRDVKLSFRRGPKEPAEKQPKAPKRQGSRGAPAAPALPLMRAFNLLPGDDPRQAKARRPSVARLVLAVVALVAVGFVGGYYLVLSTGVAGKTRERDALREQLAVLQVPAEEPKTEEEEADPALLQERQARTAALASALGGRVAWDRLLREISLVLPDDVWLKTVTATGPSRVADPTAAPGSTQTVTSGSGTVTISGYTYEQEGVARFLARLAVLPELAAVQLQSSAIVLVGEKEVVEFTLLATMKPAGGTTA